MSDSLFNISVIKKKIIEESSIENNRIYYQEELLDWIDCYNETLVNCEDKVRQQEAFNSIIDLWIDYSNYEKQLKQYKKVVNIFEDALNDSLTKTSWRIYHAYSQFYQQREKKSNAQKIFVRGLSVSKMSSEHRDMLWFHFLQFMKEEKLLSMEMSVFQLYQAVKEQLNELGDTLIPPSHDFSEKNYSQDNEDNEPESQVDHMNKDQNAVGSEETSSYVYAEMKESEDNVIDNETGSHSISSFMENTSLIPTEIDESVGISPENLIRIFQVRPPLLFSAPDKEPMSWGLSRLSIHDIQLLEVFLRDSVSSISQISSTPSPADFYIDIIESLWVSQALKERNFDNWFAELQVLHEQEESQLKKQCELKKQQTSHIEIIKAEMELQKFSNRSIVQREVLHAVVNKTLFRILMEQQALLASIQFPYFSDNFVKQLEFLVTNSMNNMNAAFSNIPLEILEVFAKQRLYVNALLSQRFIRNNLMYSSLNVSRIVASQRQSSVESDRVGMMNPIYSSNNIIMDNSNNKKSKRRRSLQKNGISSMNQSFVVNNNNSLFRSSNSINSNMNMRKMNKVTRPVTSSKHSNAGGGGGISYIANMQAPINKQTITSNSNKKKKF